MRFKIFLTCLFVFSSVSLSWAQTKISGTIQCAKPDPQYSIEVGDRANHALGVSKSACNWTKPMDIAGSQTKEGTDIVSDEVRGNRVRSHGYHVGTMASGDKIYVRFQGSSALKDGAPETAEGKWSFIGGTGKLKGIKGGGTYTGKGGADGSTTFEVEGEYELPK